jgi:hypothetical protein
MLAVPFAMPAYFPEGNTAKSTDDELRSLHKLCQLLYDANAPGDLTPFPEGNAPRASDDEQRLLIKINALS